MGTNTFGPFENNKSITLDVDAIKIAKKITNQIWKEGSEIMSNGCRLMTNVEFCKLEHHDGSIKLTRWGDISRYGRTIIDTNIRTWYNIAYKKSDIYEQVKHFIAECIDQNLPINF